MDCELIGWCTLNPEVQAAWVQAVGSVIGIAIAIGVPLAQRKADVAAQKSREQRVAKSLGTVLLRELELFSKRIDRDLRVARAARPHEIVNISRDTIPQELWDRAERLHELGDAGHHALLAIYEIQVARKMLYDGTLAPEQNAEFCEHTSDARSECETAIECLHKLLAWER